MLVEEALFQLLSESSDVGAIVADRIRPVILDINEVYPALAYREVPGGEHIEHLDGASGLKRSRFRIFATARKVEAGYKTAIELAEAVRLALEGFTGTVTNSASPPETLEIRNISALTHHDLYDDPTATFQRAQDYDIWSREPIPTFE